MFVCSCSGWFSQFSLFYATKAKLALIESSQYVHKIQFYSHVKNIYCKIFYGLDLFTYSIAYFLKQVTM